MTTYGDQVRQYGGVPVGVNRLSEIWQKDNIYFVDYDNGTAGAAGKKPDYAVQLPSQAVTLASKEAIIYIRPRTSITSSDVYYSDNITVPVTKPHLQFVGCGAGIVPGYRGSAQIRATALTTPIFTIQGSGVCIENLHINGTSMTAGDLIYATRAAGVQAVCTQIRNCRFLTGGAELTAIQYGSNQYSFIEDNVFLDCYRSIHLEATSGSPQSMVVRRNIFSGMVLQRDVDIFITINDIQSKGHIIADNIFADGKPAHATARYQKFISSSAPTTAVSTGIVTRNGFASSTADQWGNAGSQVLLPTGWFFSGNYYDGTSAAGLHGFATRS